VASPSNSFLTPFSRPFPEPSRIMSMKMPQATLNPVRNVRKLFFFIVSKISCHLSQSKMPIVRMKY
jgi:hypothetical protein